MGRELDHDLRSSFHNHQPKGKMEEVAVKDEVPGFIEKKIQSA